MTGMDSEASKTDRWSVLARIWVGVFAWKVRNLYRDKAVFRWGIRSLAASIVLVVLGILFAGLSLVHETSNCDLARVGAFENQMNVLDSKDRLIGAIGDEGRILLRREEIPENFVLSLLAAEDARFYQHSGFDATGIARAAWMNLKKREVDQGGSSITQQLARNTFPLGGRTLRRKALELIVAMRIERHFSKGEILEHYSNQVYFGSGFYGLGAAANGYFGKPAGELTLSESAMLAGLIRSPNYLSPFNHPEAANRSKERVLDRIQEEGWLTRKELEQQRRIPIVLVDKSAHRGQPIYLLSRVREEVVRNVGDDPLSFATIKTSIDLDLQRASEVALRNGIVAVNRSQKKGDVSQAKTRGKGEIRKNHQLQGSSLVVEHATGRIICAVPSRDQVESHYDRIRLSKRPPGFAFAPLVYAAAYELGVLDPESPVFDVPMDNRLVMLGGTTGILGEWSSGSRENRYLGQVPSGLALIAGKQSATVRVGFDLGQERLGKVSRAMGVSTPLKPFPSSYLGASGISLQELIHAYSSISNHGTRTRNLTLVDAILDRQGRLIFQRDGVNRETTRAISAETSRDLRRLLYEALDKRLTESEGLRSAKPDEFGITGTSHNLEDNWAVGGNHRYTWGVWLGFDKPGRIHDEAYARETTLPVWMKMADALAVEQPGKETEIEPDSELKIPRERGINPAFPPPSQWYQRTRSVTPAVRPVTGEDAWLVLGEKGH